VPPELSEARRCFQIGELARAERCYGYVVCVDPQNAEAWHERGLVALRAGDARTAVEYLGDAQRGRKSIPGPIKRGQKR
jgi:hypothetical protein